MTTGDDAGGNVDLAASDCATRHASRYSYDNLNRLT